jgi:hypothetical protein
MPFVKMEERKDHSSMEYYLRTDLIRQVDVERDDQGRIVKLYVVTCDIESTETGRSELEFFGAAAEKSFAGLSAFLMDGR